MNTIWLAVISNTVIALIILIGAFIGKKQGWKVQLIKTCLGIGLAVGSFFLAPVITQALISSGILIGLLLFGTLPLTTLFIATQFVFLILYLILYLIMILIVNKVVKHNKKKIKEEVIIQKESLNLARPRSRKDLMNKAKEKQNLVKEIKKQKKGSRIGGFFLGLLQGIIFVCILLIPVSSLKLINTDENIWLDIYDTTVVGYIDNENIVSNAINEYLLKATYNQDLLENIINNFEEN